jgi:prepilin-type N-terminal cleavage/methylation domain-containing protein
VWYSAYASCYTKHMKMGHRCKDSAGFTIVEVMIVLAVSGFMFVAAVLLINGRQGRTQFVTAINSLQQELQQTINETSSGYYPNNGSIKCVGSVSSSPTLTSVAGSGQGTNSGCLFLGKAIQFGLGTSSPASNELGVLTLVGNQYQTDGSSAVLTLAQSKPRAVYPAPGELSVPNGSLTVDLQNGLSVATSSSVCGVGRGGMCYIKSGAPTATGIVAFVAGDSTGNIASNDSSGNLKPGSEQYSLYGVSPTSAPNQGLDLATKYVGNNAANTTTGLVSVDSVSICIASATNSQSGLITIDAGLHVDLQMKSGTTC